MKWSQACTSYLLFAFLLLASSLSCDGSKEARSDSGSQDLDCSYNGVPGRLGGVPSANGCTTCSREDECAMEYGSQIDDHCRAICKDGSCFAYCSGDCVLDVGSCTSGAAECPLAPTGKYVCDEECGADGECRECGYDEQCEAELGSGARCQTHCGTCCRPTDTGEEDGGLPCTCY